MYTPGKAGEIIASGPFHRTAPLRSPTIGRGRSRAGVRELDLVHGYDDRQAANDLHHCERLRDVARVRESDHGALNLRLEAKRRLHVVLPRQEHARQCERDAVTWLYHACRPPGATAVVQRWDQFGTDAQSATPTV